MFIILYIFIATLSSFLVQGLEILYYRDFQQSFSCDSVFQTDIWRFVSNTYQSGNQCTYQCTRSDNSNDIYILSPDMSKFPGGLQIKKQFSQPYSIFGADLVYMRKEDPFNFCLYDGSSKVYSGDYGDNVQPKVEFNFTIKCSAWSKWISVSKEAIQINNRISSNEIIVRVKQYVTSKWSWYGVLKLRVWANCVENCKVCKSNNDCDKCLLGFKRYTFPSGQKVCEQTHNCNISNCFSCIKSSPSSSATCVKCLPGFQLNSSNVCIANSGSCAAGKYRSTSGCENYSTNCYLQQQNTNINWVGCYGVTVSDYKCVNTEEILIFEHRNYQLFTCGCRIEFCVKCPKNGECEKCLDGYDFIPGTKKCEFKGCPILYTKDAMSGECLKNCDGQNCKECDPDKCLVCVTENYYITTVNPENCELCSISDCLKCSGDGLCQKCANMFSLSSDKSSCIPCNVSECVECEAGQSDVCKVCTPGYLLSGDKKSCLCGVENCTICNNDNGEICDKCVPGYLISDNESKCNCEPKNCLVCNSTNGGRCEICSPGYIRDNTTFKCKCSVENCSQCSPNNGFLCDMCIQNYFPVNTQTSTCSCQVKNCQKCNPLSGEDCQICLPNFLSTLNNNNQNHECICNVENCKECTSQDGSKCETCNPGYFRDLKTLQCVKCGVENCEICNSTNGIQCDQCFSNYFPDNTLASSCSCQVKNCQKCNPINGKDCEICTQQYTQQLNGLNRECQCAVEKCKTCNQSDGSICDSCAFEYNISTDSKKCTCEGEYEVNPNNFQCVSKKCGVNQCQKCKDYEPDKCETCVQSYIIKDYKCSLKEKNYFEVESKVIENIGYNVTLKFNQKIVVLKDNYQDVIKVQILSYDKSFQTQFIDKQDDIIIKLQLILNDNCKDKKLQVSMSDPNFIQINNLYIQQKQVDLKDYIIKTKEQKQQVEATKQATQAAASTLTHTMILLVILGNSYVLFSTIDLTTFIYFLLYINVRYPDNMIAFCAIFQNFQFAFIPNAIQKFLIDPVGYSQPYTPTKFIENGADAYFMNGAGQSFTIIFGIMTIYGFLKLLTLVPIPSVKVYVLSKIKSGWEYCGFLDLIGCVYMYVLVSVLLQFYCFEFTESISFLSYSLFGFCLIAVFFIPIWMAIFITTCKDLNDPNIQTQYASLIGGLKIQAPLPSNDVNNAENTKIIPLETNQEQLNDYPQQLTKQERLMYKYSRYTNVILYFRKLIYAIIVIFLYDMVYLQMVLISIMNCFLAYFYLYIRPQDGKYDNIRNGISEIFLIVIQITVCLLVKDDEDQDEQHRYNIGWIIISCASLILFMHIFNVILDLIKATFNLVKDFICTLFKNKKELERIKLEKLGEVGSDNKLFGTTSQIVFKKMRTMNKRLSTIIFNNGNTSPGKSEMSPLRKLKMHALMVKSTVKFNKNNSENKNNDEQIQDQDERQKQNETRDYALGNSCVSPDSKMSGLSSRNIEQSGTHNNLNLTFQQLCSSRLKGSVPQSLNASMNDVISNKTSSQAQLC